MAVALEGTGQTLDFVLKMFSSQWSPAPSTDFSILFFILVKSALLY